jgi:hypothetical protein
MSAGKLTHVLLQNTALAMSASLYEVLALPYLALPKEKGTYLYLIMCWICFLTADTRLVSIRSDKIQHDMPRVGKQLTGKNKEDDPVHNQDRPEDRDVEDLEPTADEADGDGAGGGMPELELGKTADEGSELLVLFRGQATGRSILHIHRAVKGLDRGIELWLQEGEE